MRKSPANIPQRFLWFTGEEVLQKLVLLLRHRSPTLGPPIVWTFPAGNGLALFRPTRRCSDTTTTFLLRYSSTFSTNLLGWLMVPKTSASMKGCSGLDSASHFLLSSGSCYPILALRDVNWCPMGGGIFLPLNLLWPTIFSGQKISVLEFLNIYGPHFYHNTELATFMVWGKNQFIKLGSTYSNNKHWPEQFFYVLGA